MTPTKPAIEQFASDFLDPDLRHSFFNESDFDPILISAP